LDHSDGGFLVVELLFLVDYLLHVVLLEILQLLFERLLAQLGGSSILHLHFLLFLQESGYLINLRAMLLLEEDDLLLVLRF
jgi:hypothetical protein